MQTCRRRQQRFSLRGHPPATVEFRFPEGEGGLDVRCPVVDVSASGLGFLLGEGLSGLVFGTVIHGVTFCHGERRIGMDLLVLHITQDFAGDAICGCLIYPASDPDLVAFKELLQELGLPTAGAARTEAGATS